MPKTTPEIRGKIIAMHECNILRTTIAEKLNIDLRTVSRWINRNEKEGNVKSKKKAHRGKCTTSEEDLQILEYVRNNPLTTTTDIRQKLQLKCSATTITRRLKSNNIKHYIPAVKPALNNHHKEQRLGFALQYIAHDEEFWRKVIFTDEKTFSTSDQRKRHVYRLKNERFSENNISLNKRSGRIDLGFWGWVSGDIIGEIVPIEGKFTANKYLDILQNVMIPSVRSIYPEPNIIYLVEDNSPIHKAKIVQAWLKERKDIIRLDWPALSPDLNIIENIWKLVVKDWDVTKKRSKQNLQDHVIKTWESLRYRPDLMSNYSNSMIKRLNDVINANGGYTKY